MTSLRSLAIAFSLLWISSCGGTDTGNPANNSQNTSDDSGCASDLKTCPDGSQVARDPNNHCEFKKCPGE